MDNLLKKLKSHVKIGFVGGSDYNKQQEQLKETINVFDYGFAENGITYYKDNKLVKQGSMIEKLGEVLYQNIVNYSMIYMGNLELPRKRGNFIEYRKGLLNICPVGRSCSNEERDEFYNYDKEKNIRRDFVKELEKKFGGQISMDCFPKGWDKTYCLQFLEGYKIYFFGDMVMEGGNDHEIFIDKRVIGIQVKSPTDTERIKNIFL
ncbi:phosphomannomutase 2-like [Lepeophtheirus salmonis]|uniref:phosphomannomutase 2-like n=1 Tax=Lepeophtheirus salmonis TaxID=72036 RepID=UPI003AF3B2E3